MSSAINTSSLRVRMRPLPKSTTSSATVSKKCEQQCTDNLAMAHSILKHLRGSRAGLPEKTSRLQHAQQQRISATPSTPVIPKRKTERSQPMFPQPAAKRVTTAEAKEAFVAFADEINKAVDNVRTSAPTRVVKPRAPEPVVKRVTTVEAKEAFAAFADKINRAVDIARTSAPTRVVKPRAPEPAPKRVTKAEAYAAFAAFADEINKAVDEVRAQVDDSRIPLLAAKVPRGTARHYTPASGRATVGRTAALAKPKPVDPRFKPLKSILKSSKPTTIKAKSVTFSRLPPQVKLIRAEFPAGKSKIKAPAAIPEEAARLTAKKLYGVLRTPAMEVTVQAGPLIYTPPVGMQVVGWHKQHGLARPIKQRLVRVPCPVSDQVLTIAYQQFSWSNARFRQAVDQWHATQFKRMPKRDWAAELGTIEHDPNDGDRNLQWFQRRPQPIPKKDWAAELGTIEHDPNDGDRDWKHVNMWRYKIVGNYNRRWGMTPRNLAPVMVKRRVEGEGQDESTLSTVYLDDGPQQWDITVDKMSLRRFPALIDSELGSCSLA